MPSILPQLDDRSAAPRTVRLAYRPPLDWPALAGFLSMRAIDGVETVDSDGHGGAVYRRLLRLRGEEDGRDRLGWIEIGASPPVDPAVAPGRAALRVRVDPAFGGLITGLRARVRRALDLDARPRDVAAVLGPLAAGHEGVRLPGAFDGFEIAVRAILGQQITVRQARVLAARFAAAFGEPVATPWPMLRHAFPSADALADRSPDAIGELGVTRQRSRTLVALARAIAEGSLVLAPGGDVEATVERLKSVPGIGDWTAQYLAMRALGWPDAFPAADVGVMRALGVATPRAALAAAECWRPWRGYAVIHLWRSLATPLPPEVSR